MSALLIGWVTVTLAGLLVALYALWEAYLDQRVLVASGTNGVTLLLARSLVVQEWIAVAKLALLFVVSLASLIGVEMGIRRQIGIVGLSIVALLVVAQVAARTYTRRRLMTYRPPPKEVI